MGFGELRVELAADLGIPRVQIGVEARPQIGQALGDRLDQIGVGQELALDLFDRVAVGHQLLDVVDAADRLGRIQAERAAVLALAADATAARQQALLHVLAKARLGELHAAAREQPDDLDGSQTIRMSGLDRVEGRVVEQAARVARRDGRRDRLVVIAPRREARERAAHVSAKRDDVARRRRTRVPASMT